MATIETETRRAVRAFWRRRSAQADAQRHRGARDAGARGSVTGGKQMDGFVDLFASLAMRCGMPAGSVFRTKADLPLPGFFRATKEWDLVIVHKAQFVAALELKSQVGSFGNNFNNRTEEAMGSALDLWTCYREGGLPAANQPFLGWFMLLEDAPGSQRPLRVQEPHFLVLSEFYDTSYADRYVLFCKKLTLERHYTATCLALTSRASIRSGAYKEPDESLSIRRFAAAYAEHVRASLAILG
ncbi:MAG: restriction endonuclease [Planctomycetota bacterium]|nr:MAG: restriction endonuclease [Planctomycetota bacterium]